jgi:radical SAM/Cys-rich protein
MTAAFKERLQEINPVYIKFDTLQTLQINLGNLCNLSCSHCHVGASPNGMRIMGKEVMKMVAGFLGSRPGLVLDITGGCPEMNPNFRFIVEASNGLSPRRIVRSNLAIITEPGMEWLPEFYSEQRLVITASLPCYLEENVDRQRGKGVYNRVIAALKQLNMLGYGRELELNLVYNPLGNYVPGSQNELEAAYKA